MCVHIWIYVYTLIYRLYSNSTDFTKCPTDVLLPGPGSHPTPQPRTTEQAELRTHTVFRRDVEAQRGSDLSDSRAARRPHLGPQPKAAATANRVEPERNQKENPFFFFKETIKSWTFLRTNKADFRDALNMLSPRRGQRV